MLRLDPWRLRVFPGSLLLEKRGELLTWQEGAQARQDPRALGGEAETIA